MIGEQVTYKEFDALSAALQETRDGRRMLGSVSPIWFSYYYLRRDLFGCQERWMEHLLKAKKNLVIAPADHGKTIVCSSDLAIRDIAYRRNVRMLNLSAGLKLATKNSRVIMNALKMNSRLLEDFGEFYDRSNTWGTTGFTVIRDMPLKDYTVEAIGIDGEITGARFDIINVDDVITEKNTRKEEQRRKIMDFLLGTFFTRLEPDGVIRVIGTRKHYADFYNELLEKMTWNCLVEKAIIEEPESYDIVKLDEPKIDERTDQEIYHEVQIHGKPGEILCPEKWTMEELLLQKYELGSVLYNREYQGEISSDPNAAFPIAYLNQCRDRNLSYCFDREDVEKRDYLAKFGGFDPSLVMTKKEIEAGNDPSYAVGLSFGVREFEPLEFDVIGMFRERGISPGRVVAEVKGLHDIFEYIHLFFERNSFGALHLDNVRKASNIPIVPHYTGQNKQDFYIGVPSMSRIFEFAEMRFPYRTARDRHLTDIIISEFHKLGTGEEHDDTVMAFWIGVSGIIRYWKGQSRMQKQEARFSKAARKNRISLDVDGNGHGELSNIGKRALVAIKNLRQIRCNRVQYMKEIRALLNTEISMAVNRGDGERAQMCVGELKRLDRRFKI